MDETGHRDGVRDGVYVFEQCQLDPISRRLTRAGQAVKLPARLFDTLLCLITHDGALVDRDTLMRAVWSDRVVDDNSIGRAVSSLRAALKEHGAPDDLIVTAAGRGYRFAARVAFQERAASLPLPPEAQAGKPPIVKARGATPQRLGYALLTCLGLATSWTLWRGRHAAPAPPQAALPFAPSTRSVAVLPFANLSADPRQDDLADGIADELINALGRIAPLQVADRRSSFLFKTRQDDIGGIARTLNVARVLEGSIRRDGTRVRIAVQLIDAITGYQLWSHSYDREQGDILALEGEIAASVIASLQIILLPDELARLTAGGTANPQAFAAFRTGNAKARSLDNGLRLQAVADFTTAIALDSGFAMAWAERAEVRANIGADAPTADLGASRRIIDEAIQDGERAVALAPDLGEAHAALGQALLNSTTDFVRADAEYSRALALAPGSASILRRYAWCQIAMGRPQAAIAAARRATVLDPLTPNTYRTLARILSLGGQYNDAMAALQVAHTLTPPDPDGDAMVRGVLEMYHGNGGAARQACLGRTDPLALLCLAVADHLLGRQQEADAELAKMRGLFGDNGATFYASIEASWGRTQEALQWLQTAYRLRDPGVGDIRLDPFLRPLSQTPEYRRIEADLKFPPYTNQP